MGVKVRQIKGRPGWYIDVHVNGKRWTRNVGASKKVALQVAAEIELAAAKGRVGLVDEQVTFAACAKKWLEGIEIKRTPGTLRRYAGLVDVATKSIGSKPIAQVSRGDVRDLLLKYYKGGAARATVELLHSVISGICHHAIDDGLIDVSPAARAMARLGLSSDRREIQPLSGDEMAAALTALSEAMRPIFTFLFHSGCRVGEALPLEWSDVNLDGRLISINKSAKDQVIRNDTKTHNARTIAMSDELHTLLAGMQGEGLVFTHNGGMLSDNTMRRHWSKACQEIGIGHRTLHDIRHTTASLLLARGAPVTMVAAQLGHASTQMTFDRYGHYIPSESKSHINLLGA